MLSNKQVSNKSALWNNNTETGSRLCHAAGAGPSRDPRPGSATFRPPGGNHSLQRPRGLPLPCGGSGALQLDLLAARKKVGEGEAAVVGGQVTPRSTAGDLLRDTQGTSCTSKTATGHGLWEGQSMQEVGEPSFYFRKPQKFLLWDSTECLDVGGRDCHSRGFFTWRMAREGVRQELPPHPGPPSHQTRPLGRQRALQG